MAEGKKPTPCVTFYIQYSQPGGTAPKIQILIVNGRILVPIKTLLWMAFQHTHIHANAPDPSICNNCIWITLTERFLYKECLLKIMANHLLKMVVHHYPISRGLKTTRINLGWLSLPQSWRYSLSEIYPEANKETKKSPYTTMEISAMDLIARELRLTLF